MLHFPLRSPRPTHLLLQMKFTKPPSSLSGSNTSTNKFRISYRSPMASTRNAIINIGCHISFRWAKKFGCTCRKNTLQDPIGSFAHSILGRTPSPSLWGVILLISNSSFPWPAPSVQHGSPSPLFPTIIGHLKSSRTNETNRAQPRLHTKDIQ
jgi:hypothetical protein